jgi:hypothetical protein
MPSGDWKVRAGKIEVIVSEPIYLDPHLHKKMAREELLRRVQHAIAVNHRSDLPAVPLVDLPLVVPSSAPGRPTS